MKSSSNSSLASQRKQSAALPSPRGWRAVCRFILLFVSLAGIAAVGIFGFQDSKRSEPPRATVAPPATVEADSSPQQAEERARLKRQLRETVLKELAQSVQRDQTSIERIHTEFNEEVITELKAGLACIQYMKKKICSFRECLNLVKLMVTDHLTGSDKSTARLSQLTLPMTQVRLNVQTHYHRKLKELADTMNASSNGLAVNLQGAVGQVREAKGHPDSQELIRELENQTRTLMMQTGANLAVLPIELISVNSIVRFVFDRMLGRVVQGAIGTAAANLGLAVADGPLPFGEIAAVTLDLGFLTWSVFDIKKGAAQMRKKLPGQLVLYLFNLQKLAQKQFHSEAEKVIRESIKRRKLLVNETLKVLQ